MLDSKYDVTDFTKDNTKNKQIQKIIHESSVIKKY